MTTFSMYPVNHLPHKRHISSKILIGTSRSNYITPKNDALGNGNITNQQSAKNEVVQHYVQISDRIVPPRAYAVLPAVLQIRATDVIYPRRRLPNNARFGPVQGVNHVVSHSEAYELILNASSNKSPVFLVTDEIGNIINIDVADKDKSNWIGLIPLGDQVTANIWLYESEHKLYAITTEPIASRKTLKLGYSKEYAERYGLSGIPTKDINTDLSKESKSWWCYMCQRALPSASMLQRHLDVYHREDGAYTRRRRYQCKECTRTYSRLFTLRRHRLLHCTKKVDKSAAGLENLPDIGLNSVPNPDDNRIPSDESFQNYSSALDFSTNLFDTDRMPSLDISNSRSEAEFNPYGIDYKDENLMNVLGLTHSGSNRTENTQACHIEKKAIQKQNTEPMFFTCTYCNQIIVKEKKRLHVRECPTRRLECECKKVFTNKDLLAQHIHEKHASDSIKKSEKTPTSDNTAQYKCEKCEHTFKRRGMLVNHLWRVHKAVGAVPLQKRVRHYPCGSCPKMYRAAAKRDRHVARHHPGADKQHIQSIEGGVRTCEPALCPACPRQYSTRAKLLQHQRAHHPHLAPPPSKKTLKAKSNVNDRIVAVEDLVNFKTTYH